MTQRMFYGVLASLGGLVLVSGLGALAIILRSSAADKPSAGALTTSSAYAQALVTSAPVYSFFSQLDGKAVSTSAEVIPEVFSVMIDNHSSVRPQAGLSSARIVYEMPVEGGFTRYMALFGAEDSVARLGPVRSARPYFIDVAREYGNPWYLHSGGSPEALMILKSGVVRDGNEFFFGSYFVRDAAKEAPHNLFTSSSAWNELARKISAAGADRSWQGWRFMRYGSEEEYQKLVPFVGVSSTEPAIGVSVKFAANYLVSWNYDASKQTYVRHIQNTLSKDESGTVLNAATVIVQQAAVKSIDSEDRKSIGLIGSGKGLVLSRGHLVHATWKKSSPTDRTRWFDPSGQELVFVPGTMWIEVTPLTTTIEIKAGE